MPGRTLATWYGRSKLEYTTEETNSEGSGGEPSENNYHSVEAPLYPHQTQSQPEQEQYERQQYDSNYYYPSVNQVPSNSENATIFTEQRNYSPNYPQQPTQYTPPAPSSPSHTNYSFSNQSQPSHHEMSYPNSQGAYNPVSGHYGPPNHAQNNNYPTGSNPWTPQQSAADYTHHASPSPQQMLSGSPSGTPSPAHTPTSTGINSPPPVMAGQYPAHHHVRHPPIGGAPPTQSHGHPSWNHPGQQALPGHPGAGPLSPQASGFYSSLVGPPRGMPPGPPQHAHMASDRQSPHHSANPAAWNKTADSRLPPPISHQQNNGGPGNPLFSLQMLVNQDMNRAAQVNSYRGTATSSQPGTVDLSSTSSADNPQSVPLPLTRSDKPSEHSTIRNGSIATATATSLSVKPPAGPFNGDITSSSSSSIPSLPSEVQEKAEPNEIAQIPRSEKPTNVVTQSPEKKLESRDLREESIGVPLKGTVPLDVSGNRASSVITSVEKPAASNLKPEDHLSVLQVPTISPVKSPKSSLKRTKKVDSILENLVESGSVKLPAETAIPTRVITPSVIVSKEVTADKTSPLEIQLPSPGSQKELGVKSPVREEISPTGFDDDSGKPRRKRKLDKPLRLSKTDEATDVKISKPEICMKIEKDVDVEEDVSPTSSEKVGQLPLVKVEETEKDLEILETTMARVPSSSEGSEPNSHQHDARSHTKSESDQLELGVIQKLPTPVPTVKNTFIEVESEMEKMFAGIEGMDDTPSVKQPPIPVVIASTSSSIPTLVISQPQNTIEASPSTSTPGKSGKRDKRGRPKGSKNEPKSSDSLHDASSAEIRSKKKNKSKKSADTTPNSKKKGKGTKLFVENSDYHPEGLVIKKLGIRDALREDSGSNTSNSKIRGPLIRVQGPKESPFAVNVYNAPSQIDEGEKQTKQPVQSSRRKNSTYHSDLDYRGKVGSSGLGMFTSTLSARYDAHTTDRTWLCVFCKCGPHSNTGQLTSANGDLFGPYIITKERSDARSFGCVDVPADDRDINEEQKRGGRNKKSLRQSDMVEQFRHKMSKKAKRALSTDSASTPGLVAMASQSNNGEACYEIWVHEDCAVWAAGTRIVGTRIYGLQDAVWGAVPIICNKCGHGGANIGCITRNCKWRLHYNCAQLLDWDLDERTYIARCNQHRSFDQEAGPSNDIVNAR